MKLKYIVPILFLALLATACSSDDDENNTPPVINEVEGLTKIQDIVNNNHTIELYSESGHFYTGYNQVSLRIKDHTTNTFSKMLQSAGCQSCKCQPCNMPVLILL